MCTHQYVRPLSFIAETKEVHTQKSSVATRLPDLNVDCFVSSMFFPTALYFFFAVFSTHALKYTSHIWCENAINEFLVCNNMHFANLFGDTTGDGVGVVAWGGGGASPLCTDADQQHQFITLVLNFFFGKENADWLIKGSKWNPTQPSCAKQFFIHSLFFHIYLFFIIGSAEALPILCVRYFWWERERDTEKEREIDGSDVTIVALKLAMNLHFPLPKNRTIGDELTLSLAKNSHFSFLPSHFHSLPSRRHGCFTHFIYNNGGRGVSAY